LGETASPLLSPHQALGSAVSSPSGVQGGAPSAQRFFGRPFVKRFALCYRTVVCLSCLWRWCTVAKRLDGSRWNLACR